MSLESSPYSGCQSVSQSCLVWFLLYVSRHTAGKNFSELEDGSVEGSTAVALEDVANCLAVVGEEQQELTTRPALGRKEGSSSER